MDATTPQLRAPAPQISWEQILSNLDDGVITVDLEGKIVFFNEAAEVLTEISSAATTGQRLEQIFKREPWLLGLVGKSQPPRQESARGEGDFVTRWGRKTPVSVTVSPLVDRQGEFLGTIMLLRDIKHRRELEEDLKRADRLALMGTLAAGLAHEIRNPLGGIKGAAQLLRRSVDGIPSVKEFTDIMIREVDRVNQLIEQLLDLSRPAELDLAPVNIHEVLDDVLLLESQTIGDEGNRGQKTLRSELAADSRRPGSAHASFFEPGEKRLSGDGRARHANRGEPAGNRFSHSRPRNTASRFIWVDIADEGAGISEEDLPHIFSPFFTTKNSGTGLGLGDLLSDHQRTWRHDPRRKHRGERKHF